MTLLRQKRKSRGQSAVEAMFSIPVMLLVYLIGAQMWGITWNAQYAHIKARYDVHEAANHKPCFSNRGQALQGTTTGESTATFRGTSEYGGRFQSLRNRQMKAKYVIKCG